MSALGNESQKKTALQPGQILVAAGLLLDLLEVTSITVDKDQEVQIVLSGSLKRKTHLEKFMEQIGSMPFDDVIKAVIGRL